MVEFHNQMCHNFLLACVTWLNRLKCFEPKPATWNYLQIFSFSIFFSFTIFCFDVFNFFPEIDARYFLRKRKYAMALILLGEGYSFIVFDYLRIFYRRRKFWDFGEEIIRVANAISWSKAIDCLSLFRSLFNFYNLLLTYRVWNNFPIESSFILKGITI